MEEESKLQSERDKTTVLRRHSPSHGSRSSVVSPDRGLGSKSASVSDDSDIRKKLNMSDDGSEEHHDNCISPRHQGHRSEYKPPIPNRKPDLASKPKPAYSEPNLTKAVSSSVSSTPGGLLWKRRQNDIRTDIANTDKYHESRNRRSLSSSSSQLENKTDSSDTVFSNSNGSLTEDLSITSAYHSRKPHFPSDNANFAQGRSASIEVLSPRSLNDPVGSRSVDRLNTDNDDESQPDRNTGVTRRSRLDKNTGLSSTANKRISREEIQAALERADSYLKPTSTSSEEDDSKSKLLTKENDMSVSDITHESRKVNDTVSQQMSRSDTSAIVAEAPSEGLRSWAMYRKQRYSRMSDNLDDKVGDVTNLGSISDISVSGFRKASVENLSKQSEQSSVPSGSGKPTDAFAAISQSSVLNRRQRQTQVQKQDSDQAVSCASSVSENNAKLGLDLPDSGINITESATSTSNHSILSSSGLSDSSRPIPVPRRAAPSPPVGPPPPLPPSAINSSHSHDASVTSTSVNHPEPPSPAPEPGLAEEEEAESPVTKISQSEMLSSIPPVPGVEPVVQLRNKAHFVSLEEPDETSDSEPNQPSQRRAG